MGSEDGYTKFHTAFMESCKSEAVKDGIPAYAIDVGLASEVSKFIYRQVNDFTETSFINEQQHAQMLHEAELGLYILIFVNYYDENIVEKKPLFISGRNSLRLMFSKPLNGKQREVVLAELASRQPVVVNK